MQLMVLVKCYIDYYKLIYEPGSHTRLSSEGLPFLANLLFLGMIRGYFLFERTVQKSDRAF